MATPHLTSDGLVYRGPVLFDRWIIDHTCSRGMDRLSDSSCTSLEWRFHISASALAADVAGAGYDWEHASQVFSNAAFEQGLTREKVGMLLNNAWEWGCANPSKWMDLTRRWIYVVCADAFYCVQDSRFASEPAFDTEFNDLTPLPGHSIADVLFHYGLIQIVEHVTRVRERPKGFYELTGAICFNQP